MVQNSSNVKVRGDPKVPGDSGEAPIVEQSGW